MVPGAGLEPAQCFHRRILSPLRLPIPPPGQGVLLRASILVYYVLIAQYTVWVELCTPIQVGDFKNGG